MKTAFISACLLLFASAAGATPPPFVNTFVIGGGTGRNNGDNDVIESTTNLRFYGPYNTGQDCQFNDIAQSMPVAGKISNLRVALHDVPTSGSAWVFMLVVNSATNQSCDWESLADLEYIGATKLYCTISSDGQPKDYGYVECEDDEWGDAVWIPKGARIALMSVPSNKHLYDEQYPDWWPSVAYFNVSPHPAQMVWTALFTADVK